MRRRTRLAALAAALTGGGCLLNNPAFGDASGASGGSASGSTGAAGSGGSGDSSGVSGGSGSASASATGGATGPDGTTGGGTTGGGSTGAASGAGCGLADRPCVEGQCCGDCLVCTDGMCVAEASLCGACSACVAGTCTTAPGSACELPEAQRCENFVYGPQFDGCYAYAPTPGVCAGDGTCTPNCAAAGGMPAVACDQECQDPFKCAQGVAVQDLPAEFCTHMGTTEACKPTCVDEASASAMAYLGCDGFGNCDHLKPDDGCGLFRCNADKTACLTKCEDASDCVPSAQCVQEVCV